MTAAWMCLFAHPYVTCREELGEHILHRLGYEEGEMEIEIRRRNQNFSGKGLNIKTDVLVVFLPTKQVKEFAQRVLERFYTDGIAEGPSGHVKLAPLVALEGLPLEETHRMVVMHNVFLNNTWTEKIMGLQNLDAPGKFQIDKQGKEATLREYLKRIKYCDENDDIPLFFDVQQNITGKIFFVFEKAIKEKALEILSSLGKRIARDCSPTQFCKISNLPASEICTEYRKISSASVIANDFSKHNWTTRTIIEKESAASWRQDDYAVVFGDPSPEPTVTPTRTSMSYRKAAAPNIAPNIATPATQKSSSYSDRLLQKLQDQQAEMEKKWDNQVQETGKLHKMIETLARTSEMQQNQMSGEMKKLHDVIFRLTSRVEDCLDDVTNIRRNMDDGKNDIFSPASTAESNLEDVESEENEDEIEEDNDEEDIMNSSVAVESARPNLSPKTSLSTLKRTATAHSSPARLHTTRKGRKSGRSE